MIRLKADMKKKQRSFFNSQPIVLRPKSQRWRDQARLINLSTAGRLRLEWMIFYFTVAKGNAALTARHFGISRRVFHKWLKRFNENGDQMVRNLESRSRRPHRFRQWEVSWREEARVKELRKSFPHYGKKKLLVLYQKKYLTTISAWKIGRVIQRHQLYPDRKRTVKIARKQERRRLNPKQRITALTKQSIPWFLLQLDSLVIYCGSIKRYLLFAVDHAAKIGYARMYQQHSSRSAVDFLERLRFLIGFSRILLTNRLSISKQTTVPSSPFISNGQPKAWVSTTISRG